MTFQNGCQRVAVVFQSEMRGLLSRKSRVLSFDPKSQGQAICGHACPATGTGIGGWAGRWATCVQASLRWRDESREVSDRTGWIPGCQGVRHLGCSKCSGRGSVNSQLWKA
jgi:hypothetical protein